MQNGPIIDITHSLSPATPTYPKNPDLEIAQVETGHSTISKITLGTHTSTHIDAPSHVYKDGMTITDLDLSIFIGPCKVLDFSNEDGECITKEFLQQHSIQKGDRILVKTANSTRDFEQPFYEDYVYLCSEAAAYLAEKEILLFGIDYLSVKKFGSQDNRPHTELLSKNIIIVEALNLQHVEEGEYFFVGLPLKLQGLDGSPIRAVLIK